jgi:hypothetical protein
MQLKFMAIESDVQRWRQFYLCTSLQLMKEMQVNYEKCSNECFIAVSSFKTFYFRRFVVVSQFRIANEIEQIMMVKKS